MFLLCRVFKWKHVSLCWKVIKLHWFLYVKCEQTVEFEGPVWSIWMMIWWRLTIALSPIHMLCLWSNPSHLTYIYCLFSMSIRWDRRQDWTFSSIFVESIFGGAPCISSNKDVREWTNSITLLSILVCIFLENVLSRRYSSEQWHQLSRTCNLPVSGRPIEK